MVELRLDALTAAAQLVPRYAPIPAFPAIERDVNLVVDERVRWADMSRQIRTHGGPLLEQVDYRDTYRDPQTGEMRQQWSYPIVQGSDPCPDAPKPATNP